MVEHIGEVSLIEIKSGKNYLRHRAMNNLLNIKNYSFKNCFVFYDGNVLKKGSVTYLSIYLIEFLKK